MKKMLIAACSCLVAVGVVMAMKRHVPKELETQEATQYPINGSQVEVDWYANEIFFPEPRPEDGKTWRMTWSRDNVTLEDKVVNQRKGGRLYTGFPTEAKYLMAWVSGGARPTYAVTFARP